MNRRKNAAARCESAITTRQGIRGPGSDPAPDLTPLPRSSAIWFGTAIDPRTGKRVPAKILEGRGGPRNSDPTWALFLLPPGERMVAAISLPVLVRRETLEPEPLDIPIRRVAGVF